jgi:hypothetical protein
VHPEPAHDHWTAPVYAPVQAVPKVSELHTVAGEPALAGGLV